MFCPTCARLITMIKEVSDNAEERFTLGAIEALADPSNSGGSFQLIVHKGQLDLKATLGSMTLQPCTVFNWDDASIMLQAWLEQVGCPTEDACNHVQYFFACLETLRANPGQQFYCITQ